MFLICFVDSKLKSIFEQTPPHNRMTLDLVFLKINHQERMKIDYMYFIEIYFDQIQFAIVKMRTYIANTVRTV